jgi:hypothetical protein
VKTSIVYLIIGLLVINSLNAQVKIGDNPQNLDPASILELQSSNRVLVITRVTDAQMSGISPLPGAVVYNTDQGCLHYYNGTEWINICEELDNSFTVSTRADSLQQVNPNARDNTIAILESINPDGSTNYNFEVNRITGANIVDTSINGSTKLQNESVTNNKLAEKSVGLRNLADATSTGDLLMYNGTAWNFVNRTDLLNTQLDSIVGNEVVGPTDATLLLNGTGSQVDPLTLDVAADGITAFEIATDAVTTDEILDGTILTGDISDDAVTRDKVNSNVAGIGLNQAADGSLEVDNANIAPDWTTITGIPTGFADNTDNDTQLTDAQVAAAVNSEFPNLDTDATDDFSGDFTDLTNIPPNLDTDSTDDFDGEWSSLLNIPAGFADNTDNDTQLTDAQVAAAVNSEFPNLDTDATDDFSGDFTDLTNIPPNLDTDSTDDFDGEWSSLLNIPAGFADNTDNDTQLTDAQVAAAVNSEFPNLDTDATDDFSGDFTDLTNIPPNLDTDSTDDFDGEWSSLLNIPAGFADNTDNDTQLTDAQVAAAVNSEFPNLDTDATDDFSGDFTDLTNIPPNLDTDSTDDFDSEWSSLLNIPAGFADNTDNDTTYSAGTGINIDGSNTISTVNLAGDVIGPITATQIAPGVITNADIAGGAAIDGSKINPVFTSDVTTTGNFVSNGTILNVPDYVFQKYFTGESKLDKTYSFRTLSEIESYVKTYNHLPGIKSENEIRATGKYNLTESSLKHLEKIEELFLHTIEQEKKIKQLQSENQNLTKELDSLKEDLAKIKALLMESPNK